MAADKKDEADHPRLFGTFREDFRRALEREETDFRGLVTPPGFDFSDYELVDGKPPMHPKEFYEVTEGKPPAGADSPPLDFREGSFFEADFSEAVLPARSDFSLASFTKCKFDGIVIGSDSSFRQVRFQQQGSNPTCWEEARIGASTSFRGATFHNGGSFKEAWLGGAVDFERTIFEGPVSFEGSDFGVLDVVRGMEPENAGVRFEKTKFRGTLNLTDATFFTPVSFRGAQLNQIEFRRAGFYGATHWPLARFNLAISFEEIHFDGPVDFSAASFIQHVDWTDVYFGDDVDLRRVRWEEEAVFTRCDFDGLIRLGDLQSPIRRYEDLLLTDVDFRAPALFHNLDLRETRFRRVNLARISFLGSQIEDCRFTACNIEPAPEDTEAFEIGKGVSWWKFERPQVLFDERLLRLLRQSSASRPSEITVDRNLKEVTDEEADAFTYGRGPTYRLDQFGIRRRNDLQPGDLEKIALQFKRSLEASRDPIQAGNFHFAAMEMKRLRNKDGGKRGRALLLGVYRYLSGYGEQYGRALIWLGVLFFASLLIYPFAGLEVSAGAATGGGEIITNWELSGQHLPVRTILSNLIDSALLTLQNMFPFRFSDTHVRAGSVWSHRYSVLQTLLGTTLFTFFALALRRRFQR